MRLLQTLSFTKQKEYWRCAVRPTEAPRKSPTTARVAAKRLARQWAGINLSAKAAKLVKPRIELGQPAAIFAASAHTQDRHTAADGSGGAAELSDAQAQAVRGAGGPLRRLRVRVSVQELHH